MQIPLLLLGGGLLQCTVSTWILTLLSGTLIVTATVTFNVMPLLSLCQLQAGLSQALSDKWVTAASSGKSSYLLSGCPPYTLIVPSAGLVNLRRRSCCRGIGFACRRCRKAACMVSRSPTSGCMSQVPHTPGVCHKQSCCALLRALSQW